MTKDSILRERKKWFDEWLASKKKRMSSFVNDMKNIYNVSLNYSPESLNVIENFLLERFNNPMDAFDLKNQALFESVAIYIGEVHIKNFPSNLKWAVKLDSSADYTNLFNFICYLEGDTNYIGFNPFLDLIPNAISEKKGNKLLSHFEKSKLFYLGQVELTSSRSSFTPSETKSYYYHHFLLRPNIELELEQIKTKLQEYCLERNFKHSVRIFNDQRMVLTLDEFYNFHFNLDLRKEVIIELKEIADDYKGKLPSNRFDNCSSRIEFWGDMDENGNYLNHYMFILEHLYKFQIMAFDIKEGLFFDEL